jgi:hypothetical protein
LLIWSFVCWTKLFCFQNQVNSFSNFFIDTNQHTSKILTFEHSHTQTNKILDWNYSHLIWTQVDWFWKKKKCEINWKIINNIPICWKWNLFVGIHRTNDVTLCESEEWFFGWFVVENDNQSDFNSLPIIHTKSSQRDFFVWLKNVSTL